MILGRVDWRQQRVGGLRDARDDGYGREGGLLPVVTGDVKRGRAGGGARRGKDGIVQVDGRHKRENASESKSGLCLQEPKADAHADTPGSQTPKVYTRCTEDGAVAAKSDVQKEAEARWPTVSQPNPVTSGRFLQLNVNASTAINRDFISQMPHFVLFGLVWYPTCARVWILPACPRLRRVFAERR
jgi:hypothetical protein